MEREYITSQERLPADLEGEVTLQLSDAQTREIFETRARVAEDPDELTDPVPLVVRSGPHEDNPERWYVELIESPEDAVDHDLLRRCIEDTRSESNVINARSADLKAVLAYLVETGTFDSRSAAARTLLARQLVAEYRPVLEAYGELKDEYEDGTTESLLR